MKDATLQQHRAIPPTLGAGTLAVAIGLGFALPPLGRALIKGLDSSPLPTPGLVRLVADLPFTWSVPIMAGLGVIGALYVGRAAANEALTLTITEDHLEYSQNGYSGWISKADISSVYRDGKLLVFLDHDGLVRHKLNDDALPAPDVQKNLIDHGYPWQKGDPFEAEYVKWLDGHPEFTSSEHRLLREYSREKDAETLKRAEDELMRAGLVARRRRDQVQVRRSL